jgi:hypothetical protein
MAATIACGRKRLLRTAQLNGIPEIWTPLRGTLCIQSASDRDRSVDTTRQYAQPPSSYLNKRKIQSQIIRAYLTPVKRSLSFLDAQTVTLFQ